MAEITLSDLLSQETKRHPFAFTTHLRSLGPLHSFTDPSGTRAWLVTAYDDVAALLRDLRLTNDVRKVLSPEDLARYGTPEWRRDLLRTDPPDHTRLRRLVSKAFTPRMIERLRPRIQQITNELIDAVEQQGHMEMITDFAYPLPITVICDLLGIPPTDRTLFRDWTRVLVKTQMDPAQRTTFTSTQEELFHYIKTLLAHKREHPDDDLISGMLQAREQADELSEHELISTIFVLILAGHETTTNLISVGTLVLLQHSDQLRQLQSDPSLLPGAIEELLRYTGSVSMVPRWANEEITLHGQVIRRGEAVYLFVSAANTDERQFPEPDVLNLTRQDNQHLAFGKGIHYCLGAPLARLEGHIAFETLFRRLPNLRLAVEASQLTWNPHPALRGLATLPVTF